MPARPQAAPRLHALRQEIAFHQQELIRLQTLVAVYDAQHQQQQPSDAASDMDVVVESGAVAGVVDSGPLPVLSVRVLDEAWAKSVAQQSVAALPWMREWAHPFARPPVLADDAARAATTAVYMTASEPVEELLTRLCRLAREIFHVKWAAVALVEENFVHLRASDTVHAPLQGSRGVPRLISLCNWVIAKHDTLVIPDMASDPAMARNPVCCDFGCRFYAAAPLITTDGVPLGTFCVMDTESNEQIGFDQKAVAILELMASAVMSQLELAVIKQRQDRLHEHVLSAISHELRTPIHGILGLCDSLDGEQQSTEQLDFVPLIRREAHTMISLVNDMIDYFKLDSDELSLRIDEFNLRQLLSAVHSTLQPAFDESRVSLSLVHPFVDEAAGAIFEGDERRIRQILLNLLGNALKFSKRGHGVEVRAVLLDAPPVQGLQPSNASYYYHSATVPREPRTEHFDVHLYVQVADMGCGISHDRLSQIFTLFSQSDQRLLKRRFEGAGLGLSLCRKLVELMKGQLLVESKVDDGSVFHVLIPLRWADDSNPTARQLSMHWRPPPSQLRRPEASPHLAYEQPGQRFTNLNHGKDDARSDSAPMPTRPLSALPSQLIRRSETSSGTASPLFRTRTPLQSPTSTEVKPVSGTVLIVDDNQVNLKVAVRMLHSAELHCVCAASGREALRLVQSQQIDVVLMDLQMPEMDGLECTAQIRDLEAQHMLHSGTSRWKLPIIALTASDSADLEQLCRVRGMDGCLFKPCGKQALRKAVMEKIAARRPLDRAGVL